MSDSDKHPTEEAKRTLESWSKDVNEALITLADAFKVSSDKIDKLIDANNHNADVITKLSGALRTVVEAQKILDDRLKLVEDRLKDIETYPAERGKGDFYIT